MNRVLTIGVVVTVVAAGWWAWQAHTGRGVAEAAVAAERARVAALRADLARDERRAAEARAKAEAAQTKLAAQLQPAAGPGPRAEAEKIPSGATTWAEAARKWGEERERPEVQVRWFEQLRATNRRRYDGLFRQLGLSEAQREQFIRNFSEREERHSDLNAAAQALGIDPAAPEIVKARGELYADHAKAQKALLGEAGYRALQEYDRTSSLRESVGNLAGLAAVSGVPLAAGQTDALVRALAETVPQYRSGGRAALTEAEPAAVDAALRQVLTPEQYTVLTTQEAPGAAGGIFHARWNGELNRAAAEERKRKK